MEPPRRALVRAGDGAAEAEEECLTGGVFSAIHGFRNRSNRALISLQRQQTRLEPSHGIDRSDTPG